MFQKVHHVAYTVDGLDAYRHFFEDVLGTSEETLREMPDDGYRASIHRLGETYIEIQEPFGEGEEGQEVREEMETFLQEESSGLNHIAFEVDDIAEEVARLEEHGIEPEWDEPIEAPTFPGCKLLDMDPGTSRGIYIQLVEESE